MKTRRSKKKEVAVLGFIDGVAGQIETWFETVTGFRIACFVHDADEFSVDIDAENRKRVSQLTDYPSGGRFKRYPFIVSKSWDEELRRRGITKVLPVSQFNRVRQRHIQICRERGFELVSAIHPSVQILAGAQIGPGTWINAGSLVGYKTVVGSGVLVNTGVQFDHHNVIEDCCEVSPRVTTAGYVTLRECCTIYTGAIIINRKEVGADAVVGAGAVVIRDVPPGITVVGVPAKPIHKS